MKQGLVRLLYNFGKRFMGWALHMIMCVLLCYPVSIRIYYQQGVLFLVDIFIITKCCEVIIYPMFIYLGFYVFLSTLYRSYHDG